MSNSRPQKTLRSNISAPPLTHLPTHPQASVGVAKGDVAADVGVVAEARSVVVKKAGTKGHLRYLQVAPEAVALFSATLRDSVAMCVCLLLQDLLQSCGRGGRRIVEDMCDEIRRAEACVD